MLSQRHKESDIVRFAASLSPETVSDDARSVEMLFYSGAKVERFDWANGEKYFLRLGIESGECQIEKLDGAPLLDSHMDFSVKNVLGVITEPRLEADGCHATAKFSDDPESDIIFRKVKNGTLRQVSVGAVIGHLKLESKEGETSSYLADSWYPREVSIVPLAADVGAHFLSDQLPIERLMAQSRETAQKERIMSVELASVLGVQPTLPPIDLAADPAAAQALAVALAITTERDRASGINAIVRVAKLSDALAASLIDSGVSLADARIRVFEALAKASGQTEIIGHHAASVGQTSNEKEWAALQNALEYRAGIEKLDAGRPYAGMTLLRIAEKALELSGVKHGGSNPMMLAENALRPRVERFAGPGYQSTGDFPGVLSNVVNKSLRNAYESYPATWMPISRGTTISDFRPKTVVGLGLLPVPVAVGPSGEFKYVKLIDESTSYSLVTYGSIVAINRQAIVNDDLNAFGRIPSLQGRAFGQLESNIIWALLTSNPLMNDSVALFHATHGNLAGTGTAISQTSLGAARAAMRIQTGTGGVGGCINVEPRYLIVPAALETVALQQTSAQFTPATGAAINTFKNLVVIVEPRLDAASTTAWYMAADPGQLDLIEHARLTGQEGIFTETRYGFDVDGVEFKAREDFGAQILDWRGVYKNTGA